MIVSPKCSSWSEFSNHVSYVGIWLEISKIKILDGFGGVSTPGPASHHAANWENFSGQKGREGKVTKS